MSLKNKKLAYNFVCCVDYVNFSKSPLIDERVLFKGLTEFNRFKLFCELH